MARSRSKQTNKNKALLQLGIAGCFQKKLQCLPPTAAAAVAVAVAAAVAMPLPPLALPCATRGMTPLQQGLPMSWEPTGASSLHF